ncbi:hypothetical protein HU200_013442 [Digitaria exilis]|uniref:GBF-interacting protein 1 N-terminal domain-containing protein n=1 Tax=Digitaria exilis TaxID=1010633 RepID=A0A835FCM9_9POAL|nr:hypothetical protein HU200_013442 [Digitaria exilis]
MAAGSRVSIPAGVRRTVADIKEIAGGHTDEEVYAMLRECNMDPNETAQRLLLQDTFHEVKRKRDKKKEGSKEQSDSRWRPALQGRGGKSGRGNYSSHTFSSSNDSAGLSALYGKKGMSHITKKGSGSTPTVNENMDAKASTCMPSLSSGPPNGPSQLVDPAAVWVRSSRAVGSLIKSGSTASADWKGGFLSEDVVPAVCPDEHPLGTTSPSNFVVVPSLDSHVLGDVDASSRYIGTKKASVERKDCDVPIDNKGSSQQSISSSFGRSSGSRPSSSYSSRSQQSCGSQKGNICHLVIPNKEWKPKATSLENVAIANDVPLATDAILQSAAISNSVGTEDLLKVDKSFNDMPLLDKQHVIIPDHLQVSDSEKYGLSFGSFNASFQQSMGSCDAERARSSLPQYGSSHELNGSDDGPQLMQRDQNSSSPVQEGANPVPRHLPFAKLENCAPSTKETSSIAPTESDECRDDSATSGVPESTAIPPSYVTYGLAPQSHGNQIAVIEKSESKVQPPVDFSTNSTQTYQPASDANEQASPFLAAEAHKWGNIPVLPAQVGQDHEGNNSPMIASPVPASIATPASGVVPTSVAIPQQSVPVFRQPLGVHIPHFPTNYLPYNQYISPFFIPPPTLHPFMGNSAFPQPLSTGAIYPAPGNAGILPPVKYSLASFKSGPNTGSQASIGLSGGYGTYGSSPSVYTNNTTVSSGNQAENDDVTSSQVKENSIYIAGFQTEGSALWVPTPGHDISGLQANSFYGLPPQGQQVTFAPQSGPFGGIYHPAHTVAGAGIHPMLQPSHTMAGAVEIVGAPGSVYQHPQAQMTWGSY